MLDIQKANNNGIRFYTPSLWMRIKQTIKRGIKSLFSYSKKLKGFERRKIKISILKEDGI